jgi:uncharacterized membrane protein YbhN (UPF0104 family)
LKFALRLSLSFAVAGVLVWLLLVWSGTSPGEVWRTLRAMDSSVYWTSLAVQAAIYPLRAARFRALLDPDRPRPLARLIPITAAHSLTAYLLPAKVGEASLVVYLKRGLGLPGATGLAVLFVARLLDFATVAGALAAACLVIGAAGSYPQLDWLLPLGAALLVPTLVFAWLGARGEQLVRCVSWLLRRARLDRSVLGARALGFAEHVRTAMQEVRGGRLARAALWTLPIWALVFLFYAVLARGLGLSELCWAEAVFGSSLAVLSNLLPINGFAGFGTQDMGWVFGFTVLGAARDVATQSALAFHVVYVFNMVVFGVLGHAFIGRAPQR